MMLIRNLILVSSVATLASASFNATAYVNGILRALSGEMTANGERNWAVDPWELPLNATMKMSVFRAFFAGLSNVAVGDECSFKNKSGTVFVECLVIFPQLTLQALGNLQNSPTPLIQFSATGYALFVLRTTNKKNSHPASFTTGIEPQVELTFQHDPIPENGTSGRNARIRGWIQAEFMRLVSDEVIARLNNIVNQFTLP